MLGKGEFDKKKHEIKHDKSGRTAVTDVNVIALTSPGQVRSLLALAHALAPARAPAFLSPAETAPVGVFESQRYMALEATRLTDRHAEEYTAQAVALLHVSCDVLISF